VFGRNPLLSYFSSGLFYGVLEFIPAPQADGSSGDLKMWLTRVLFESWLPPHWASFAFALAFTVACWRAMLILHRKNIFLKV
jgi:predicted acyltransferase